MPRDIALTRRERIVRQLEARIRAGELKRGQQLAGEARLAAEFDVSRGTIRQALADLQQRELITTRAGLGSFITFDGTRLDTRTGWAKALAESGVSVVTELLAIEVTERRDVDELPEHVALDAGVDVRRVRRTGEGTVVSYEVATVPCAGELAELPQRGLVDDSLTATLAGAGLVAASGEQTVTLAVLDTETARITERHVGAPFLRTVRTALDTDGGLVEHVVSYLDPDHFRLHLTFGAAE